MAYTKQEWADDDKVKGKVNATRMTHIEQGIYDNSLAIDKINPSGTATTSAEIEEGQVNDVIGFKSLKLKGQTSQYTTQGNNLLNIYARHPAGYTETVSGVTITYNDDGSISAKGTATADINYFLASKAINGDDVFNGTHYLSGCSGGSATTFYLQFWADTVGTYQQTTTEVTTNKTAGVNWNITIGIKNGVTINKTFYPMMSATSGKTFEKYSGGKASPNPDFPQDVNNVSGDNVVGISNKNLIEYSFKGYNITSQGKFETGGTSLDFDVHIAKVKAGTTYTITPATNVIAYFDERPTITSQAYNNSREVITNTNRLTPTRSSYIAIRTATSNTAQLEKGTSATSYIAHQGNNFEINLGNNLMKTKPLVEATANGITFTPVYDGNKLQYVNVNGTSTAVATYTLQNANVDSAGTYVDELSAGTYTLSDFSGSNTPNIAIFLRYTTNGSTFTTQNSVDNKTFTVSSNFKYASYIRIASGTTINNMKFYPQIEKGNRTSYAPCFPPIELCKTGTFQDYIFKRDGKWWKHKAIEKIILNGTETWSGASTGTGSADYTYFYSNVLDNKVKLGQYVGFCNNMKVLNGAMLVSTVVSTDTMSIANYGGQALRLLILTSRLSEQTVNAFKTWLSTNKPQLYYVLATPIEEEITYIPLLRQLDELYNSGLYDVTNISQNNSSEAFILDIEACKNNINGIVEYIRR